MEGAGGNRDAVHCQLEAASQVSELVGHLLELEESGSAAGLSLGDYLRGAAERRDDDGGLGLRDFLITFDSAFAFGSLESEAQRSVILRDSGCLA
jgi:hypothetical protein